RPAGDRAADAGRPAGRAQVRAVPRPDQGPAAAATDRRVGGGRRPRRALRAEAEPADDDRLQLAERAGPVRQRHLVDRPDDRDDEPDALAAGVAAAVPAAGLRDPAADGPGPRRAVAAEPPAAAEHDEVPGEDEEAPAGA